MDNADIESKLIAYSMEFLKNYTEAIDINFPGALDRIRELGMDAAYFPLHARTIGTDVAVAALFTPNDFYMFFVADRDKDIAIWEDVDDAPEFNRDWTFNTPDEMRSEQALDHLGVSRSSILPPSDRYDSINIPGTNFIAQPIESIVLDARSHGTVVGNEAGQRAEAALPRLLGVAERKQALAQFRERYEYLRDSSMRPQSRGQQFEKLWRDLLDFYGWRPKKIRIPGEENDFTAIYQGLHILGEVRWFSKPMSGGKMREFLGKLDPRPQTIGLFVSHSGFSKGASDVARRAVNSKTAVVFELVDIKAILVNHADIGAIFDRKLRDAYDYIFEHGQEL